MRRTALIILAVAGGLTALLLIAVAIAVATVDVRTLVAPVQARVKAETGRDLVIAGPIDLKLSLEPKLVVSDVTLANAPWGAAPALVHAKRVDVQVALLPLLQKRFELVELTLVDPAIALETDAKGRSNWDLGSGAAGAVPADAAAQAAAGAVLLGNLGIEHGTLTYRDGATGRTTHVAIDRLLVRSRSAGAPVEADFKGTIDDVAIAVTANLGPLDALRQRHWPYPVAVKGDVDGKPASISTKIAVRDDETVLDALEVAWGTLAVTGELRVSVVDGRRKLVFALAAPSWSLADAAVAGAVAAAARGAAVSREAAKATPSRFLFSERTLPLAGAPPFDAEGTLAVAELAVNANNRLRAAKIALTLSGGVLDVSSFSAAAYGGTLSGRLHVDAARAGGAGYRLHAEGRDLDLGALLAAIGEPREVRGGKTALVLDLAGRGDSLHQWAASATGQALLNVGPATLVNTRLDLNDVMDKLSSAVNPFRQHDPSTELTCAVLRLPLVDGVAKVDRSIAMETGKLGVSASGTLDFRDERLDLTLRPRIREGIPIDIPQVAELVHFSGPFTHPQVAIDAVGSMTTIAKIGAAISTGGLSMIGTSLLAKVADDGNPCAVALGSRGAAKPAEPATKGAPAQASSSAAPATADPIGKALGKLLGR